MRKTDVSLKHIVDIIITYIELQNICIISRDKFDSN
jgi:hypothetical protein